MFFFITLTRIRCCVFRVLCLFAFRVRAVAPYRTDAFLSMRSCRCAARQPCLHALRSFIYCAAFYAVPPYRTNVLCALPRTWRCAFRVLAAAPFAVSPSYVHSPAQHSPSCCSPTWLPSHTHRGCNNQYLSAASRSYSYIYIICVSTLYNLLFLVNPKTVFFY